MKRQKKSQLTEHSGGTGTQAGDLGCEVVIVGEGAAGCLAHVSHHHCDVLRSCSALKQYLFIGK